jgi:hypothetical protein
MSSYPLHIQLLRDNLFNSIFNSLGIQHSKVINKVLRPILWPVVDRFSKIAYHFDKDVYRSNLVEAMQNLIPQFATDVNTFGTENIPNEGPLLIVSNHPGTFDELVIASNLPRKDLSIVAQNFPFLESLIATKDYLIFTNHNPHKNLVTIRSMIRHLKEGKSLLIFPSGKLDPDPAFLPGATQALNNWSQSIELIIKKAPDTKVLVSIISGVLSPQVFNNPLIKLFKDSYRKQSVAEGLQIAHQIFFPNSLKITPNISFSKILDLKPNKISKDGNDIYQTIIIQAQKMLSHHIPI